MKKLLAIALSVVMLLSLGVVFASAVPGFYCTEGGADSFAPVGTREIQWDPDASTKLDLTDGNMDDWTDYNVNTIELENMIAWQLDGLGRPEPVPSEFEGWRMNTYFVADKDYLYIGFYTVDPDVALVPSATQYTSGDAFQFAVDFGGILGDMLEADTDLFQDQQNIFYSFGPMGEGVTPIQMFRQRSDNDIVVSEAAFQEAVELGVADPDDVPWIQGTTFLTEDGWAAEFAMSWQMLYDDFAWKAWAEQFGVAVGPNIDLEIGCSLYYQNHNTDGNGASTGMVWAAGTMDLAEDGTPSVEWTPADNGANLVLKYQEGMEINCSGIVVSEEGAVTGAIEIGTEPPAETDAPETDAPETDAPETDAPAETQGAAATEGGDTEPVEGGCASVIGFGSVAVLLSAAAAAVVLKKKD